MRTNYVESVCLAVLLGASNSFSLQNMLTRGRSKNAVALFDRPAARVVICRGRGFDEDDYFEDDDYDDGFDEDRLVRRNPGRKRPRYDDLGGYDKNYRESLDVPSSYGNERGFRLPQAVSQAIVAGAFVLGVGLGVTVDSAINTNPRDLASRDAIDQAAPNSNLCASMGASAMAFDQRVFVSFNPFNVYVAQADVKPACVLRPANVVPILKDKKLINDNEVRECKNKMNTFAFVGNLDDTPQISCVYKSEDAQNEFLSNPKYGIGEDYLDDDRARAESFKKSIKGDITQGQREQLRKQLENAKDPK